MQYDILPRLHYILLLFLYFMIKNVDSKTNSYKEFLQSLRIPEKFKFLSPVNVLQNHVNETKLNTLANGSTCIRDLLFYKSGIAKEELWALEMIDASSKVPLGVLNGNLGDLGVFDECIKISVATTDMEIHGQHCIYYINPTFVNPLPTNLMLSMCVPTSCTNYDMLSLLNDVVNDTEILQDDGVSVTYTSCSNDKSNSSITRLLIFLTSSAVYICFLLFCTTLDFIRRKNIQNSESNLMRTLISFSYLKNAEQILSLDVQKEDLMMIHGIRAISAFVIVVIHQPFVLTFGANLNIIDMQNLFSSWLSSGLILGSFSVDTFFILSSFLMTRSFFDEINRDKKINLLRFYLRRYIRLTLPLLILIGVAIDLFPFIGSGPLWKWVEESFLLCKRTWWAVPLYILNFTEYKCLIHLWYMSVDMQLYWISPLILYPLHKKPKIGFTILVLLFLVSVIFTTWVTGVNKYSAIFFQREFNLQKTIQAFYNVYEQSHMRLSSWVLGIVLAYEVHKNHKPSKVVFCVGWIAASICLVILLFGIQYLKSETYEYTLIPELTFAAFAKPAWAFIVCWIIFASIHDCPSLLTKILSWKLFLPISRISYSLYIVHFIVMLYQIAVGRTALYFSLYSNMLPFCTNMFLSTVAAFFFCLTYERPMLVLNDLIFKKKKETIQETQKLK